jgi:hypothetical protein
VAPHKPVKWRVEQDNFSFHDSLSIPFATVSNRHGVAFRDIVGSPSACLVMVFSTGQGLVFWHYAKAPILKKFFNGQIVIVMRRHTIGAACSRVGCSSGQTSRPERSELGFKGAETFELTELAD